MSENVKQFLLDFKHAATTSSGIDLVPREVNMSTLSYLGITKKNLEEILLGLSVVDYCKGPIPDKGMPGELWEFGKDMDGQEVLKKLKVVKDIRTHLYIDLFCSYFVLVFLKCSFTTV